jgi:hypothetical protein
VGDAHHGEEEKAQVPRHGSDAAAFNAAPRVHAARAPRLFRKNVHAFHFSVPRYNSCTVHVTFTAFTRQ